MTEPKLTKKQIALAKRALDNTLAFFEDGKLGSAKTTIHGGGAGKPLIEITVKRLERDEPPKVRCWGWAAPHVRKYIDERLVDWPSIKEGNHGSRH